MQRAKSCQISAGNWQRRQAGDSIASVPSEKNPSSSPRTSPSSSMKSEQPAVNLYAYYIKKSNKQRNEYCFFLPRITRSLMLSFLSLPPSLTSSIPPSIPRFLPVPYPFHHSTALPPAISTPSSLFFSRPSEILSKTSRMRSGSYDGALVTVETPGAAEAKVLDAVRMLPRPPGHDGPLRVQTPSFQVTCTWPRPG